jgi:cell division protein ZapE
LTRVRDIYEGRIAAEELERDPAQQAEIERLDALAADLEESRARAAGPFSWWRAGRKTDAEPKGLYLYGSVGRGKTMLMDIFFDGVAVPSKRRAHFHTFMKDVHERIFDWRRRLKAGQARGDDPIAPLAEALADEARLLCFDEFFVTDIADAMVLGRLFTRLFDLGVVLVATSNVAPDRLYEGGLNRALFLPFLRLLEQKVDICELSSRADFRLEKLTALTTTWFTPAHAAAKASLDRAFRALTGAASGSPTTIEVFGRALLIRECEGNVARFSFADLCERPLGAADYVEIARRFHTVLIDNIPTLGPEKRNEARRFIWLVDALYDSRVKLIASAQAAPDALYRGEGTEAFEFARAASRLIEMRSKDYLALPHGRETSLASGDSTGLVET